MNPSQHEQPSAEQPMACRTCARPLNRHLDLGTGKVTYLHPIGVRGTQPPHDPVPVPADEIDPDHVCDFCSDRKIIYVYQVRDVETVLTGANGQLVQHYGSGWSACIDCAHLLERQDLNGLHTRVMRHGLGRAPQAADAVKLFLQAVIDGRRPGRAIATTGRWEPAPPAAPILPKVRDRLTNLLRGPDHLPPDLNHGALRTLLADSFEAAHLYWIDDEFTDMAEHAARSLPATTISATDLPAPHGLVTWAQPVGDRRDVAAGWTTGPDGVHIVGYRSVGAGLEGASLQRLREQVGWLTPRHHRHTTTDDVAISATDPAATLIATWLLIAQKLAEATPSEVDKSIRKAYQRTGRPAPQVRLVRIRGHRTASDATPSAPQQAGDRPGVERQYRWWVRGHWRNQPYGPGRAQRRLIYIDPQLRGPEDKPINASTTVRILGTTRAHSDADENGPAPNC
jgi:hypothetical protein